MPGEPTGRAFAFALVAVALLACALRVPVADLPFERDEGEYAYIAQRSFAGDVPYRDAFNQKPPAIFAFFAAVFAVAGESVAAVRWAAQLWTLAGLVAIAVLGARIATRGAGVAAAIAGAACAAQPYWLGNAVNTEPMAMTPIALGGLAAFSLSTRDRVDLSLATGALGGVTLLFKPVTAPIVAYQIATALWYGRSRLLTHATAAAVGLAFPLAATGGWFALHGAWHELLDAVVWNNFAYGSLVPLRDYPVNFAASVAPSLATLAPIVAAALAAPFLALRAAQDRGLAARLAWLVGWLAATLAAVSAGGYYRHHYFPLALAPLAVLAGIGLDAAARAVLAGRPAARWGGAALALALLGWVVGTCWWYFGPDPPAAKMQRLYEMNPFPEAPALGRWIAARSHASDSVFVYGSEPELLFYARRRSASRYNFVYPVTMPLPAAAGRQRELLAELDAAPPLFVVAAFARASLAEGPGTPPDLERGLRERLERDYDLVAVVPYREDRSTVVLEYVAARAAWSQHPLWGESAPWAAYVVWKRREGRP